MKKKLHEIQLFQEEEKDGINPATYGRPSVSAWVAAAAVAFAFFLLGGFIKTYRQLETLREESRREIAELRESLRQMQSQSRTAPPESARRSSRVASLPRPRQEAYETRERQPQRWDDTPTRIEPLAARAPLRPESRPVEPEYQDFNPERYGSYEEEEDARKPRVQFGRRSNEESRQMFSASGGPCQVVSVSTIHKRIMIEGGRDVGLSEGGRLELCRDGRWIGDLRIIDVFDNQSSCEVLHSTLTPEPGDTVRKPQR